LHTHSALDAPSLAIYFNGVKPPGSTNFTANSAAATTLVNHLIQFFALSVAFNCTDGTIGAYQGNPDMVALHQPMMISAQDSAAFNNAVISILANAGVSAADQTATLALLRSFDSAIIYNAPVANPTATTAPTTIPRASSAVSILASASLFVLASII